MLQKVEPFPLTVSVVMCTYNGAAFVEAQLLSVLAQTYPLKEVLIFDDVSTDGTLLILQRIAAQHPVVKLHVNEKNKGYTHNFEQAMQAATGDALAICDQDDLWLKEKIEKLVQAWKPECPLIYCYSYLFEGHPPVVLQPDPYFRRFEGTDARKIFLYNTVSGHAMLIRRSFLPLVLPLSPAVSYDWWMAVVAAYNGGVQYLPEILVCQRLHAHNITVDFKGKFSKKESRARLKQMVVTHCRQFALAPHMPPPVQAFALQLARLTAESVGKGFYFPLFRFIVQNRKVLFNYKNRKIGILSHVKHSYRRTIN